MAGPSHFPVPQSVNVNTRFASYDMVKLDHLFFDSIEADVADIVNGKAPTFNISRPPGARDP
jgi:hypothetical protein